MSKVSTNDDGKKNLNAFLFLDGTQRSGSPETYYLDSDKCDLDKRQSSWDKETRD